MDLNAFITVFSDLHEKARRKALDGAQLKIYHDGREALARAMVAAQRLTLKEGQTPREAMRVARAVQIDLDLARGRIQAVTLDISRTGFSALLEKAPPPTETPGFTLRIPGIIDPVVGRCKPVDISKLQGHVRAGFAFQNLSERDLDKIEMMLFDSVIEQFRKLQPPKT